MKPVLYESSETNFSTLGIGVLSDAISCYVKTVLNGLFELEMQYPITGMWYKEIKISRIIKATAEKGGSAQLFDIYAITKPINGVVTVNASHVSGRKQFIPIMPCSASNIIEAFDEIEEHAAENNPFTLWTSKDTVANFNLKTPASLGQVLGGMEGSILDTYRGEYEFDNFTIKFMTRRGQNNGVSLRYGKNITDIEQEESIASTITGICPFWADESGNSITLPEMTVDSPNAANFPFKRTVTLDLSTIFQEQPTEAQIRAYAQAYVSNNQIGVPKVGISVSFENLADYEEFKDVALLEQVRLGDTVHVYFEPLDITAEARVTETNYDVLNDKYKKIRVGSVKSTLSQTINNIENETAAMIDSRTSGLEQAFERALDAFSGIDGGNIIIRTNPVTGKPYEILAMDTADVNTAQKVTRLNYEGIGISSNGINGPYTMALVAGQGIVATAVYTGILNSIAINNGNGTFTVDAAGNVTANSLSSNNANISGGSINMETSSATTDKITFRYNSTITLNGTTYYTTNEWTASPSNVYIRYCLYTDSDRTQLYSERSSHMAMDEFFTSDVNHSGSLAGIENSFHASSTVAGLTSWQNGERTAYSVLGPSSFKIDHISQGAVTTMGGGMFDMGPNITTSTVSINGRNGAGVIKLKQLSDGVTSELYHWGVRFYDSSSNLGVFEAPGITFYDSNSKVRSHVYADSSNNAKLLGNTTSSSWTSISVTNMQMYRAFVLVACRGAVDGGRGAMASTYIPYELARLCTSESYESHVTSAQNSVYAGRCYFDFTNNRIYLISSGNADCRIKIYGIT